MKIFVDVLGWTGSALVLIAYYLVSTQRIDSKNYVFHVLNSLGSACLIANTLFYRTYPVVTLNLIWLGIGISSLVKIYRRK